MKARKNSKKAAPWFIKVRGSYLPKSGAGWLTYVPYLGYLIGVSLLAYREQYGLVTTLLVLVPNWIAAAVVMNWIADRHA